MAVKYKYQPYSPKLPKEDTIGTPDKDLEKAIKSLSAQKENLEIRLDQVAEEDKPDKRTFLEKAFNLPEDQGFLMDAIEIINRPVEAVKGFIVGAADEDPMTDPLQTAFEGLSGERGMTSFSEEVIENVFDTNTDDWDGVLKFAVDLAGDIAFDPLTYVPAGAILSLGKKALKIGSRTVAASVVDTAFAAGRIINQAKGTGRVAQRAKSLIKTADDFAKLKAKSLKGLTGAAGEVQEKSIKEFYERSLKGYMKKAGFEDDAIEIIQQGTRKVKGRNLKDYAVYVKYVDPQNPSVIKYVQTAVLEGKGIIDGGKAFALNTVVKAADVADTLAGKALKKTSSIGRKFLDNIKDITLTNGKSIPSFLKESFEKQTDDVLKFLTDSSLYKSTKDFNRANQAISDLFFDDLVKSNVGFIAFNFGTGVDDVITLSLEGAKKYLKFSGGVGLAKGSSSIKNIDALGDAINAINRNLRPTMSKVKGGKKFVSETLSSIVNTGKTFKKKPGQLIATGLSFDDAAEAVRQGKTFVDSDGILVEVVDAAKVSDNEFIFQLKKSKLSDESARLLTSLELVDPATGKKFLRKFDFKAIDETDDFLRALTSAQKANVEEVSLLARLANTETAVAKGIAIDAPKLVTGGAKIVRETLSTIGTAFNKSYGFAKDLVSKITRMGGRASQLMNEYNGRLASLVDKLKRRGVSEKTAFEILESGGILVEQKGKLVYRSKRVYSPEEIFRNIKLNLLDEESYVLLPAFSKNRQAINIKNFEDTLNNFYSKGVSNLKDGKKAFRILEKDGSFAIEITNDFKKGIFRQKFNTGLMSQDNIAKKTLNLGKYDLSEGTLDIWKANQDIIGDLSALRDDISKVLREEVGFTNMSKILEGKQGYLRHTLSESALNLKKSLSPAAQSQYINDGLDLLRQRKYLGTVDEINKGMAAFHNVGDGIFDMDIQKSLEDLIQVTGQRLEQHQVLNTLLKGSDNTGKGFFQVIKNTKEEAGRLGKDFRVLKDDFSAEFGKLYKGLDPRTREVMDTFFKNKGLIKGKTSGAQKIAIHKSAYNYLASLNRAYMDLPGFVKLYDGFLNRWKSVTLISPGYHLRNLLGNATNSYLAGMNFIQQTRYAKKAFVDMGRFKKVKNVLQGLDTKTIRETFIEQLGEKAGREKIKQLTFEGVFNRPDRWEVEDIVRFGLNKDEAASFRRFVDFKESGAAQSHKGFRDLDGVKKTIKDGKRLDRKVVKLNYDLAENVDDYQRYMLYQWAYDKSMKGADGTLNTVQQTLKAQADASTKVAEALFDYSHLTGFEKEYMKRLFPFYTFFKNNLIFQTKNIIARPGKYAALGRAYRGYVEDVAGMDIDAMPDYMAENMWIPIPFKVRRDDKEAISFLKANLPISDYTQLIENPFREGANFITTPVKLLGELATGREIFTGREFAGPQARLEEEKGVLGQIRDATGNLSFRDGTVQKVAQDLGLRVPMNYASVVLDLLDTTAGKQSFAEGTTDFFTRMGLVGTQTEQNLQIAALYQDLEKLRESRKLYETTTGEKLPGKKKKEKAPEIPGLDEYLRSLGG